MKYEPAMLIGTVTALLALLVGYGVLDPTREMLWRAAVIAVVPLVQALVTRGRVIPVARVEDAGLDPATLRPRDLGLKEGP